MADLGGPHPDEGVSYPMTVCPTCEHRALLGEPMEHARWCSGEAELDIIDVKGPDPEQWPSEEPPTHWLAWIGGCVTALLLIGVLGFWWGNAIVVALLLATWKVGKRG